jgi:hypothetical protein
MNVLVCRSKTASSSSGKKKDSSAGKKKDSSAGKNKDSTAGNVYQASTSKKKVQDFDGEDSK